MRAHKTDSDRSAGMSLPPSTLSLRELSTSVYSCLESLMNRKISSDRRLEFAFLRVKDVEDAFRDYVGESVSGEEIEQVVGFLGLGFLDRGRYTEDHLRATLGRQLELVLCLSMSEYKYSSRDCFQIVAQGPRDSHVTDQSMLYQPASIYIKPRTLEGQNFSTRQRDMVQNQSRSRLPTPGRVEVEVLTSKRESIAVSPTSRSIPKSLTSTLETGAYGTSAQSHQEEGLVQTKSGIKSPASRVQGYEFQPIVSNSNANSSRLQNKQSSGMHSDKTQAGSDAGTLLASLHSKLSGGYDFERLLQTDPTRRNQPLSWNSSLSQQLTKQGPTTTKVPNLSKSGSGQASEHPADHKPQPHPTAAATTTASKWPQQVSASARTPAGLLSPQSLRGLAASARDTQLSADAGVVAEEGTKRMVGEHKGGDGPLQRLLQGQRVGWRGDDLNGSGVGHRGGIEKGFEGLLDRRSGQGGFATGSQIRAAFGVDKSRHGQG